MSARLAAATLVLAAFAGGAAAQSPPGIAWVPSVTEARAAAQQQKKLVLLHFYSDDCMPCRLLETRVFPLASVTAAIQRGYVPVKVNTAVQKELAQLYNVYTWPTDVITDSRGRELYRTVSPQDPNRYVGMLTSTLASYQSTLPYNEQVDGQGLAAAAAQPYGQQAEQLTQYGQQQLEGGTQHAQQLAAQAQQTGQQQFGAAQDYAQQQLGEAQQYGQQQLGAAQQYGQQQLGAAQQYGQQQLGAAQQYGQQKLGAAQQYGQQQLGAAQQYGQQQLGAAQQYGQQQWDAAQQQLGAAQQQFGAVQQYAQQQAATATPGGGAAEASGPQPPADGGASQQAPPYGQLTQNPYLQSSPPAAASPAAGPQPTAPPAAGPQSTAAAGPPPLAAAPSIAPAPPYQPPAASSKPVGLDGFCPVTLMTRKKWAKGDERYGVIHRGRTYKFATEEQQQAFLADPDRYSPMLSGYDPVVYQETGRLVEGQREHGITYMNHMFLFQDEESLQQFCESRDFYLNEVRQAMQRAGTTLR